MIDVESCRQYAADCVRQAQGEQAPEDKNILLNVALAWLRLAHQTQELAVADSPALDADVETEPPDDLDADLDAKPRELAS